MLILKSLFFQNIGRFTEAQQIDFTQLGSLVQIDGKNNVTSGSSGAGKSTIFKAINWLLGLDGPATTVLQSRLTKDHIEVSAVFDYDGLPLKISRDRKLAIELNGEVITGSSKLTEEKLDEIIGMDRGLFSKILHKKQGSGGFFLDMGPSDVHKFLTKCLSLDKESAKLLTLNNRLDVLTSNESTLKTSLESNKSGLQATESAIVSLGEPPVSVVEPSSLEVLKRTHNEAIVTHKLVLDALKSQMEELEKSRPQIESVPYDRSKIVQLELEINDIKAQIALLEKKELERQSKVKAKISELQIESSKLENAELIRQNIVKNQISAIRSDISSAQLEEQKRQSLVKASLSAFQVESIKCQSLVAQGTKAKEEATALAKELLKVRGATCPTCEQGWITDACKAKEAEILAKLSEHKKTVIAGNEASNKIVNINEQLEILKEDAKPKLVESIAELQGKISQLELETKPKEIPEVAELAKQVEQLKIESAPKFPAELSNADFSKRNTEFLLVKERKLESDHQFTENAKSQLILANYASKQTEMRKEHQSTIQFAQDAENRAFQQVKSAEYEIKAFEEAKAKFEVSKKKLSDQFDGYHENICLISKDLMEVQEELELATESKQAIKSYLSCSFEDALESIGDTATKLIRNTPNMASATVQFDGLKENKDGKVKEEVNAVISMEGEVGIPVKSLSGGERSSTDLAIDLAVIQFIEERTQKGINIMALDEAFTGMDTVNISETLEMLKAFSTGKQLLIVDHNQISSQAIQSRLTVVRDGQTSRIVQ